MKTNKIDNNIKDKFLNRTFEPSASAWERLSIQLDEQPKQKKIGWFFYIGAAASILLLVSIGVQLFSNSSQKELLKEEIVISPINLDNIDKKINNFIKEAPVKDAIVQKDGVEVEKQNEALINIISINKKSETKRIKLNPNPNRKDKIVIAKVEKEINSISNEIESFTNNKSTIKIDKKALKQDPNSTIKINSEDLLYAVTHNPKEVKVYYTKYNLNREDVLKAIKSELKKSNIKINPNTILAEVERTIDDDDFQNNFMKSLKRRVSDIASVIASRND